MTDTHNSAQKENRLIAASVNGVGHSMFCHNHLRNNYSLENLHLSCVFIPDSCPLLVTLTKYLVSVKISQGYW